MESHMKQCCTRVPQRWVFAVLGSLGILISFTLRTYLAMAITEMVIPKKTLSNNTNESHGICTPYGSTSPSSFSPRSNNGERYEWDEYTQGVILSSFFWGFITMQIPGSILAIKFGGKYVSGLGTLCASLCTLSTPVVVRSFGAKGLIIIRILTGVSDGACRPATITLISQWAPPDDRSKMTAVVLTGTQLGTIFGTALSGVLIQNSAIGWPLVSYVFGTLGILWFFAWVIFCYNHPDVHPFITDKEKNYLNDKMSEHINRKPELTPWRHILTSVPVAALIVAKCAREWSFQMMIADLPKYMSNILKFPIQANGFLSSVPHVAMWIVAISGSWLADWLIKSDKISRTNVRKMFTSIAGLGSAVFILGASYAGCDRILVVILFTVSIGFMGCMYPGLLVNSIDLSPNYSGPVMSILTAFGSLSGILAPYVVGVLTPNQTVSEWRSVFWITFAISCVSTLIFDLWADGEVQYWNDLDSTAADEKEKNSEHKEAAPFIQSSMENDKT